MEKFNAKNISTQNRQFELFGSAVSTSTNFQHSNNLKIKGEILTEWRNRIHNHQLKISQDSHNKSLQETIFPVKEFFSDPASRTFCKAKFASSIVVIKFLNILTR